MLGSEERIFEASRRVSTFRVGIDYVKAHANLDRSLSMVLLIGLVIGAYLVLQQISRVMGKRDMLRLFSNDP